MLELIIPAQESFNEQTNEFVYSKECKLTLEHSLVSISKWEAKWEKPFLGKQNKTVEEARDYIRCMTITQNVDPNVYNFLTNENVDMVSKYIEAPMTATWFSDGDNKPSREIITSELIYYWMIALGIPMDCQKWHLNRLLTLIKICNVKAQDPKKMSKSSIMNHNKALNQARRAKSGSKG